MKGIPAELIKYHVGGGRLEGDLGESFVGWFQLWPINELENLNRIYEVALVALDHIGIGSNGGGELIAIAPGGQVVALPFIAVDPKDSVVLASSWEAFEEMIRNAERGADPPRA